MELSQEDIQVKKANILKYIGIGLGIDKAYTLASVTDEERALLESDECFALFVNQGTASLEFELLQTVHRVMKVNERRGKSDEARFLLGVVNPVRYGNKKNGDDSNGSVTINFGKEYEGV